MYRVYGLFLLSMIGITASAQSIDLYGKVSDKNGKPVSGAIVMLINQKLTDTTDAAGAFSFMKTHLAYPDRILPDVGGISLMNGIVSLILTKPGPVSIEMFDMQGKLLKGTLYHPASAGDYEFDVTVHRFASNTMVIRVSTGQSTSTLRYIPISNSNHASASSTTAPSTSGGFARLQAIVDSLKVTAAGYITTTSALTSLQGQMNIVLDTITLDKFSFFATSLKGLQTLSGNANGFGGDLRFGKTGQGAGLLGADSICQCLAEKSMPGSKDKIWRAFLSVTKGPTGTQVNAIDRIGTGPWYDRIGRLVAKNINDLLKERPNADPAIKNDLPNEDGIPNHRPDPTRPAVDNHQFITGSDTLGRLYSSTATCQDWASSSDTASNPRCGLSYPRAGMAFGVGGDTWAEWNGNMKNWISVWNLWGCKIGTDLSEASIRGEEGVYTIGNGGGYGGFYCFALNP